MMLKRVLDVALAAAGLVLLSPLFALISVAIVMETGWPAFYSQWRVGRRFVTFRIWKFRTMVANGAGLPVTAAGDARITPLGRFLRRAKFDELPQLWNVLRGDMSLVGPRPEVPRYVELFRDRYERILELRPGITDPASLAMIDEETVLAGGRDPEQDYLSWVLPAKLDVAERYAATRSTKLDLAVLLRTAAAVFRRAYPRAHGSFAPITRPPL